MSFASGRLSAVLKLLFTIKPLKRHCKQIKSLLIATNNFYVDASTSSPSRTEIQQQTEKLLSFRFVLPTTSGDQIKQLLC